MKPIHTGKGLANRLYQALASSGKKRATLLLAKVFFAIGPCERAELRA